MGLTADIGLPGIMLGIQRVELLLEPVVGRYPGVYGASNRLGCRGLHDRLAEPICLEAIG
jgi:hypothetical protein